MRTVIPANDNFFVLLDNGDINNPFYKKIPIIAWEINIEHGAYRGIENRSGNIVPIFLFDLMLAINDDELPILHPSGFVRTMNNGINEFYFSEDEWWQSVLKKMLLS